jgi:hypothetical protein
MVCNNLVGLLHSYRLRGSLNMDQSLLMEVRLVFTLKGITQNTARVSNNNIKMNLRETLYDVVIGLSCFTKV